MRTRVEAKDSTFKPGDHVVIQAGYGGKGGQAGQDFKRFNSDTPAVITDIAGGDVYVRPEGSNYKWKVQAKALVEGTTKASAHGADRRSRLHRALDHVLDHVLDARATARDAVMDSCGTSAKDGLTTMTNFNYGRGRSKELDTALDAIKKIYEEHVAATEKLKEIGRRIVAANAVWRKLDNAWIKAHPGVAITR
jgi:hypothetical protein